MQITIVIFDHCHTFWGVGEIVSNQNPPWRPVRNISCKMDVVRELSAYVRDMIEMDTASSPDWCAENVCADVYLKAVESDTLASCCDKPSYLMLERSSNAGVIAVCLHLWIYTTVDGMKLASALFDNGRIDIICCCKTLCNGDNERCFHRIMRPHMLVFAEIIKALSSMVVFVHPSGDDDLVDFVTDDAKKAHIALKSKNAWISKMATLFRDSIDMGRDMIASHVLSFGSVDPVIVKPPTVPHGQTSTTMVEVDLCSEASIIRRAFEGSIQERVALRQRCSDITQRYGNKTTFFMIACTNRCVETFYGTHGC